MLSFVIVVVVVVVVVSAAAVLEPKQFSMPSRSDTISLSLFFFFFCSTDITLGFELAMLTFSEPPAGVNRVARPICVTVREGTVGTPLIVVPSWMEDTATSSKGEGGKGGRGGKVDWGKRKERKRGGERRREGASGN